MDFSYLLSSSSSSSRPVRHSRSIERAKKERKSGPNFRAAWNRERQAKSRVQTCFRIPRINGRPDSMDILEFGNWKNRSAPLGSRVVERESDFRELQLSMAHEKVNLEFSFRFSISIFLKFVTCRAYLMLANSIILKCACRCKFSLEPFSNAYYVTHIAQETPSSFVNPMNRGTRRKVPSLLS